MIVFNLLHSKTCDRSVSISFFIIYFFLVRYSTCFSYEINRKSIKYSNVFCFFFCILLFNTCIGIWNVHETIIFFLLFIEVAARVFFVYLSMCVRFLLLFWCSKTFNWFTWLSHIFFSYRAHENAKQQQK